MEISDDELYGKYNQKIQQQIESYSIVYRNCVNAIKTTSKRGDLIHVFEIPSVLVERMFAKINVELCAEYIINQLKTTNKNIKSEFIAPNILFLDWSK